LDGDPHPSGGGRVRGAGSAGTRPRVRAMARDWRGAGLSAGARDVLDLSSAQEGVCEQRQGMLARGLGREWTRQHPTLMRVFKPRRGRATGRPWGAAGGLRPPRPWAVGGLRDHGAVCPWMRWVPGARGDRRGDRLGPAPVWQRTATPPRPPPRPRAVAPRIMAATRVHRQTPPRGSQPALPPPVAAVTRPAAGIAVGADAPVGAGPPRDDPHTHQAKAVVMLVSLNNS
jgi:hypothetical protein